MSPIGFALSRSNAGEAAMIVSSTHTGMSASLRSVLLGAQGGAYTTERDLVTEDVLWDSVSARHSDALDALLASLNDRADLGEDSPLDFKQF